ncbi:TIM barrel protein [Nocardia sp. IBHARD005]|uniref:TIM barrel protein n=1 Tax=Nocardia sp. IBHARD005 TaxID=3457765 RepID=UPI0040584025
MNTIAFATTTRPWGSLPLERALIGAVRAGFHAIALPVHGVAEPVTGDTPRSEVLQIGKMIDDHGLALSILSHEADFGAGEAAALAVLRRQIEHCAALGVAVLVDVGCGDPDEFDAYFRLMGAGARYAADHGVTIAVKPHGGLTRTVADTVRAVERVGHHAFGVCLDPGMLVHHAGDAALDDLPALAPYVVAVGVRDYPGRGRARPDTGHDAPGVPRAITPGDGIVDFAALYQELDRHGFTGPSAVESLTPGVESGAVDAQARRAHRYLGAVLGREQSTEPNWGAQASTLGTDCSTLSTRRGEALIGTARHFDGYLVMEVDLPWPRAMGLPLSQYPKVPADLIAPLRTMQSQIRRSGRAIKALALAPDPHYSRTGFRRVMRFDLIPAPTTGYRVCEYVAPDEQIPALLRALYEPDPGAVEPFEQWLHRGAAYRDLLVCTHGSVDACCGTYGYPLYERLREQLPDNSPTRAWRVSSFGGHRFAPTLIDLPDGRYWGNLEPADLRDLIARDGDLGTLLPRYRGSGAWRHPIAQVAESALFASYGWSWPGRPLDFASLDTGADARHARLLAHVSPASEAAVEAFAIDVDLVDDAEVLIGCSGLLGSVAHYTASAITPVDSMPQAVRQPGELNLDTSAHSIRGKADGH